VSTMNTWWSDDTIPLPTEGYLYPQLLRDVEAQSRRYRAAALQPPCAEPSFDALMGVALGRCLSS